MNYLLTAICVMAVILVLANLLPDQNKKIPSGNCRNCPEFRYCGGGRRGCGRRGELKK